MNANNKIDAKQIGFLMHIAKVGYYPSSPKGRREHSAAPLLNAGLITYIGNNNRTTVDQYELTEQGIAVASAQVAAVPMTLVSIGWEG